MKEENNKNIKWIAIQPLTGGMYLGAEEAIGHPAEFILSFEGLNKNYGNEQYLEEYLKKHNRLSMRYDIQEGMFDSKLNETLKPTIKCYGEEVNLKYEDIDLVVAVPVCSGLSNVTSAPKETKEARNCNMRFITEYTLKKINPKIYVFENAPTLMGSRGKGLVEEFKNMAKENGYSVLFYKTNTKFHNNCQNRPRTFVVFFKHNDNVDIQEPFSWEYENKFIPIKQFFSNIDNSINGEPIETALYNKIVIDFLKEYKKDQWREYCRNNVAIQNIILENKMDDLIEFAKKYENNERSLKYFEHIKYKKSLGLNYFGSDIFVCNEYFPSIQFKTIPNLMHPIEDRTCSVREILHLMGHPDDFEWITGNNSAHFPKIGQNVPVKTAKFIVEQCIKSLNNWDKPRGNEFNAAYQDNTKGVKVW